MKFKKNFIGQDGFQWWIGVVEDRDDPEKLGRCRVRIFGTHTDDIVSIPTEDLPWALPIYSVNNNDSFSAPREGEYVFGFFLDGSFCQSPAILGVIPGINRQLPPVDRGFGDLRDPKKIRNSPKKPIAIDFPEAPSGQINAISGNVIDDAVGLNRIIRDNIIIHIPLSLKSRASYIEENLYLIGYNHKFTAQELKKGHIDLSDEIVPILGINGADTIITELQARKLLTIDIQNSIESARDSIGEEGWDSLNVPQKAGLSLSAYNLGAQVNFQKDGISSAVTSGDIVRAAQLLSTGALKSLTGKYLHSENILSHAAATLFKSIAKTEILSARANNALRTYPIAASGVGIGVQVHEADISTDDNAESLKYPLQEDIGKPSISDLATKLGKSTTQRFRERSSIIAIGANNESWSEPASAYAAEYPHNKVKETESGHIFELDDTPGYERIHLAHRSGSFEEYYPSGSKVEKIVKNNYKIVMSDDHLYVAGKVNIVLESDAYVKVVGNCFLQVENDLNATVSGNVNYNVGEAFNVTANTIKFDSSYGQNFTPNTYYSSGITTSLKRGTPTAAQKYLERDKIVRLSDDVNAENNRKFARYLSNPNNYRSNFRNAKPLFPPILSSGSDIVLKSRVGDDLIITNDSANIFDWFNKQLRLAANGYWRESGVYVSGKLQPSNPNILNLWTNLGFMNEPWTMSDQSNWAIAFVNFALKQNGYRYVQTPNPKDVEIRSADYNFSRVNLVDAKVGDVVLWNNDHINFVYENLNGYLRYIGGCQPPDPIYDVADSRLGDVSIVGSGGAQIVAILRPSKT